MLVPSQHETRLPPIRDAVRQLAEGRSNAAGQVTLRANETTTTVISLAISKDCMPQLTATTSNAAAALGTTYVSSVAAGSFVITHDSDAAVDRTFNWHAVGG